MFSVAYIMSDGNTTIRKQNCWILIVVGGLCVYKETNMRRMYIGPHTTITFAPITMTISLSRRPSASSNHASYTARDRKSPDTEFLISELDRVENDRTDNYCKLSAP